MTQLPPLLQSVIPVTLAASVLYMKKRCVLTPSWYMLDMVFVLRDTSVLLLRFMQFSYCCV